MTTATKQNGRTSTQGNGRMGRGRIEPDTSTYSGRLGVRITALRKRQGLTVSELADKLGVHEQTVYKWESGQRTMDVETLPALFRALGCQRLSDLLPPLK